MFVKKTLCAFLLLVCRYVLVGCRSYNNGLIFYNLENQSSYLPPTISVSRGRGLAKFKYSSRGSIWSTFGKPCDCEGPLCGCCVGIRVKQYNFDQKICANVSYARPKDEVHLEVFLNDTASAKYGISARNPSPLCVPIMMGIPMSMCIQMSNIAVQGDNLNMCMDFLVRLASTELFEMHFQCMKVGLQGASWVGTDGQPVIPANEGKLKVKPAAESEEYYDESAAEKENEITSQEKEEDNMVEGMQEEDMDKAEEEMDYNEITEKLKDIVKEKEEEVLMDSNAESEVNENESNSVLQDNERVEEIVTNIMNSINQANKEDEMNTIKKTSDEIEFYDNTVEDNEGDKYLGVMEGNGAKPISMEKEHSQVENVEQNSSHEKSTETKVSEAANDGLKELNEGHENSVENYLKSPEEKENVAHDKEEISENAYADDMEHLHESQSQDETKDSNKLQTKPTTSQEAGSDLMPIIVLEETTTKQTMDEREIVATEKYPMLGSINSITESIKVYSTDNNTLETIQLSPTETSVESTELNSKATKPQESAATTEITDTSTTDNAIANAATITTTKTGTTTTNKPTKSDIKSTVAATFIKTTNVVHKHNNDDNLAEEEDGDEDNDNDNSDGDGDGDGDGDNSHENDSDYEDEESEEAEDETKETEIESNNATTIIMSNTAETSNENGNSHKESLTLPEVANESYSNESQSKEETQLNTNDEFKTVEGESEENDSDEEYDEEFEDYETTATSTVITTSDSKVNIANDTCCKPALQTAFNNSHVPAIHQTDGNNTNTKKPQIPAPSSNNLQSVSKSHSTISQTDDNNTSNVASTINKMSQATVNSASLSSLATISATGATNVIPLPLARKSYSLHHQQQPQQQRNRQNRQHPYYA